MTKYLDTFEHRDWDTSPDETIRIALIGLGWWTIEEVIPAIEASDYCEVSVLVTGSREKGERVATDIATMAETLSYKQFHEGDAQDAYDAVYVCTPNAYHLDYAETAAELGKAVLCEKPIEANVDRAQRMVERCESAGINLLVAYRMQTTPTVRRARELIQRGTIGKPRFVNGVNCQSIFDIFPNPDQWRLNSDLTGYGTSVMDLGIYHINTSRFLLNKDPIAVHASMRSDKEPFDDVPDELASFVLEFEGGLYSTCSVSQNAHAQSYIEVIGTDGRLRIEPAYHLETDMSLSIGEQTVDFDTPEINQMTELFDFFAVNIVQGIDDAPDGRQGLEDLQAIEAIHRAAETEQQIQINR
nr:D-xylose 1-dehydrogenase Gfo6 [Haladaptatus sp. R4]